MITKKHTEQQNRGWTAWWFAFLILLLIQSNIALGAGPGTIKWSYPVDEGCVTPAIGHNGTIYVSSGSQLLAINPNGTLKWSFDTGLVDEYVGIPSVDSQDNIYFVVSGNSPSYIYALSSNKNLLWKKELLSGGFGSSCGEVAISPDSTIYASGSSRIQAFDPTGQSKWIAQGGQLAPAISQAGNIFAINWSDSSPLVELDSINGLIINNSSPVLIRVNHPNPPAMGINGDIYIAGDGASVAFSNNLTQSWRNISGGRGEPPVIDVDGTVYYTSRDGGGYYFDAVKMDGTSKFKFTYYPPDTTVAGTPAIGNNGYIYVPSIYEGLVAFNNAGDVQWHTGGAFKNSSTPAIMGSDGTIYLIGYIQEEVPIGQPIPVHYSLYAIQSSSTGPAPSAWPMYGANAQHTHVVSDVSALTPIITSITPTIIPVNQPVTFTVAGVNLPDGLSFNLPGCSPAPEQPGGTATQRQFVCNPTQIGTFTAEVKNAQGDVVSGGSVQVTVSATAPTVTAITPTVVTQNVPATFTVVGTNLPDGLSFNLAGCSPAPEQPGGTATQRQFVCTPKLPDILTATVKDVQGNTVSGGTAMIVVKEYWQEINPPGPFTSPETPKDSKYLVLITHGWNSSAEAWPNELVRAICNKLGVEVRNGTATGKNDEINGIDLQCDFGPWHVVSANWKCHASILKCGGHTPRLALSNGEFFGRLAANNSLKGPWQYVHLIGHSAGAGFIDAFAKKIHEVSPDTAIHTTLLDAFCPNADSCSYGQYSSWAEQYFDHRYSLDGDNFGFGKGETEVHLDHAYNFDITMLDNMGQTYPGGYGLSYNIDVHAFPYKYYIKMAGGTPPKPFDAYETEKDAPLGPNLALWTQSIVVNPAKWLEGDKVKGLYGETGLCELKKESGLGLDQCINQRTRKVDTYTPKITGGQITDDQCLAGLGTNANWFQSTVTAKTCLSGQQAQATRTVKALDASALPNPGMALLRVTLSGPANRLSFDYRFTEEGADGALQVFIDNDELAYVTTQALDGVEWRHAGRIDIPTLQAGEHTLRIVVKALNSHNAGVEVTHILYEEAQSQAVPVPAAPVITSGPSGTVNTTSATFTFTGEAGVTFECGVDSGAYQACASPFTVLGLSNGQHLFAVRAKDAAGNTGPAALRSWTVRKTFTSPTITGTGTATAVVSGGGDDCDFDPAQTGFVNPIVAPPAGVQFPHGLFRFHLVNCDTGGAATLRVQWPTPANGEYWKYNPVSQRWYAYPGASFDAATSTWTFTITDNGPHDADPTPGAIADPTGPAARGTDVGATGIPTLSEWAMLLFIATFLGIVWMRRGTACP